MTKIFLEPSIQVLQNTTIDNPRDNLEKEDIKNCFNNCKPNVSQSHVTLDSKNVEQVWMPAFFTLSVDPSFTEDGKFLLKNAHVEHLVKSNQKFFLSFPRWIKQIINYIKKYFNSSQKDWRIYTCFQDLKKIEKEWNLIARSMGITYVPDTDEGTIWQPKAFYLFQRVENQFYEKLSEIGNLIYEEDDKKRMFPSELFLPMHKLYAPQNPSWNIENILQSAKKGEAIENLDIVRIAEFGYQTLSKNVCKGTDFYMSHSLFANDIKDYANSLVVAIRKLRRALREEEDLHKYEELFNEFKTCWNAYIDSNPLLQELSIVYSNNNFFKDFYNFLEKSTQDILYPRSSDVEDFTRRFTVPCDKYKKIGYKKVEKAFKKLLPHSSTTKLLKIQEELARANSI
ncbi:hypothetical protein RHABOEDO_000507 [Candidatus Rhabdochlamydia oedothoracis]|uniref:Uncharacterized protein n=1 Tax=Candidatus Rhabdochlamydia oedothoracis TaxID=2720720 RepID=A0ABX8V0F2_9BACT|nr:MULTISPECIES: hypothetical protein [Rhabdochlamydia]KAG6559059.1 hypothetical protein RHOW815_000949 [Candidatus Rhabdochlamydia sp. W815]QYF48361.1 hypothetical protein RHABOEDO_000507 [Candidatus Rhabdochlamydia oedothoracis]